MIRVVVALAACSLLGAIGQAKPLDPVTYLLPAPEQAIVFAPFLLARHDGGYAAAGLDVRFRVIPGGTHVGEALGRGEGDLGGAIGDTPILLRARNVPVRGVALLGHHSFVTLMMRSGLNTGPAFSGEIDVPSLQDTTHYALKAWMRSVKVDPARVSIRALPTDQLIDAVDAQRAEGMVGTVDWGVRAERLGARLDYRALDNVYPAMAQAIMASDKVIRHRPAMVRAFVRVTLASIRGMERDPAAAADRWRSLVPDCGFSRDETIRVFTLLRDHVYGDPASLGRFDPRVMSRALAAAKTEGLVPASAQVEQSYTNRFLGRAADQTGK